MFCKIYLKILLNFLQIYLDDSAKKSKTNRSNKKIENEDIEMALETELTKRKRTRGDEKINSEKNSNEKNKKNIESNKKESNKKESNKSTKNDSSAKKYIL